MRTLVWHVHGTLELTGHSWFVRAGGSRAYTVDRDYWPKGARLYMAGAPLGSPTVVDILDDGVSLFDNPPQVDQDTLRKEVSAFKADRAKVVRDSVLTLGIKSIGNKYAGNDLTVELDLEADS